MSSPNSIWWCPECRHLLVDFWWDELPANYDEALVFHQRATATCPGEPIDLLEERERLLDKNNRLKRLVVENLRLKNALRAVSDRSPEHLIQFTNSGATVQHPLSDGANLFACAFTEATGWSDMGYRGVYVLYLNSEGEVVLGDRFTEVTS